MLKLHINEMRYLDCWECKIINSKSDVMAISLGTTKDDAVSRAKSKLRELKNEINALLADAEESILASLDDSELGRKFLDCKEADVEQGVAAVETDQRTMEAGEGGK